MTKRLILKKSHRKGSLARRVLLTATLLLILPLFIHTVILYVREYRADIVSIKNFLKVAQGGRVELLEGQIKQSREVLEYLSTHLDQMEIFHAEKMEPAAESDSSFFTRLDPEKKILWAGKNLSSSEAIGIPFDLNEWIAGSNYLKYYTFPVQITMNTKEGAFIAGDEIDVKGKRISVRTQIASSDLFLELSVPLLAIQRHEIGYYSFSVFILVILIGVVGGGIAFLFTRRISRPFEALCNTMEKVSEGSIHTRYQPDEMGFEINALGEQFNETLDELLRRTEEAERERIDRERLAQEVKISREIQLSMLPTELPQFPGLELAPGYVAAQEVSGDFYDFFPIDQHRVLFVVADSAGKGIPACLYSLGFRSALRAIAGNVSQLSEIIRKANDLLLLDTKESGFFITAWLGLYDARLGKLEYCSQGHPPALLRRDGKLRELSTQGISFGVEEFVRSPVEEIYLKNGDFLLLYTDGVIEAHNPDRNLFGQKKLEEWVQKISTNTPAEFIDKLLQEIKDFAKESPQFDDITLLVLKFSR